MMVLLLFILSFYGIFFLYFALPWLFCFLSKKKLTVICRKKKAICLTFDDGPGERVTGRILELLDKYDVKATFFVLGKKIEAHKGLLLRIQNAGHEICSHGYAHINYWDSFCPFENIKDMKKAVAEIEKIVGNINYKIPFRPPFGKLDIVTLTYLFVKKIPVILWTIDSGDTRPINRPEQDVLSDIQKGGVLLCHDFDRATVEKEEYLLKLITNVLASGKLQEMKFCTVSELLDFDRPIS